MIFKRSVQRYGRTPEPATPYQKAGQLWDERIGSARVQARNWRLMAFGCLGLTGALSAALIWQSMQSRVVPYVVAVDRLGEPRALSEAEKAYQPTDPQIAWHLGRFIRDVRSVSIDPVLMRREWLEAYDYASRRGAQFLDDYARKTDPFGQVGERIISVEITSVIRASDRSFQVKWTETAYERGAQTGRSSWTAIVSVVTKTPATVDVLRKNPLGLYVDAIDWSREYEAPQPVPVPAAAPPQSATPRTMPIGSPLDPTLNRASPASPQEVQP
ncbi:MAG TPA: conjugal transfer protein TrbF [Sphingobium sp.]|uniref:conjugal transfer protein TrbF n=1 Tax=Sphingobium sp. TaxID=1912891 RepID=UPI002ECFDE44